MTPGLLAFGFAAPWLLAGAAFAAAPLIIHLLFRRQHRETRWAAMQFLLAAARQQRRWLQLEELLLLALRTAIPLLAAIALAGPVWEVPPQPAQGAPRQRVLALDASLSMTALADGQSAWDRARQAAVEQVEASRPGDVWQVVRLAGQPPYAAVSEPAVRVGPVLDELRSLSAGEERALLAPGLETVQTLLDATPAYYRKEVLLFTDAQRTNWRPTSEAERGQIRTALKTIGSKAHVVWWEAGRPIDNTAITSLVLAQPYVFPGEAVQATATVKHFGSSAVAGRKLDWLVNGRLAAVQSIDLLPGDETTVSFRYTASVPGDVRIEARLSPDGLPADDRRGVVALVRDAVRVLLVDGRPSGVPFENATDLLRLALAPPAPSVRSPSDPPRRLLPTTISDGELLSTSLADFDVVFLCDVPLLTDRDSEVIRHYVAQGGAVVVCLGPQVRADAYNQAAYGDGAQWLPARLGELTGNPRARDQAFAFSGSDLQHPILGPFRGNPNTGFELTQTFAYLKCQPAPNRAAVVLRYDSGDPAIVEAPYRRGRVLLVTTAVDRSWGTWAVWGHTFVPMIHEAVQYLVSFQGRERNGVVGEPLTGSSSAASGSLTVRRPNDRTDTVVISTRDGEASWEYASTTQAGFYGIELPNPAGSVLWFARNIDPRESDLAALGPAELRDDLLSDSRVSFDLPTARERDHNTAPDNTGSVAGRWLLGAVLLFLLVEPFLTWNRQLGLTAGVALALPAVAGVLGGASAAVAVVLVEAAALSLWWQTRRRSPVRTSS